MKTRIRAWYLGALIVIVTLLLMQYIFGRLFPNVVPVVTNIITALVGAGAVRVVFQRLEDGKATEQCSK